MKVTDSWVNTMRMVRQRGQPFHGESATKREIPCQPAQHRVQVRPSKTCCIIMQPNYYRISSQFAILLPSPALNCPPSPVLAVSKSRLNRRRKGGQNRPDTEPDWHVFPWPNAGGPRIHCDRLGPQLPEPQRGPWCTHRRRCRWAASVGQKAGLQVASDAALADANDDRQSAATSGDHRFPAALASGQHPGRSARESQANAKRHAELAPEMKKRRNGTGFSR